jgi:hypothetical protein
MAVNNLEEAIVERIQRAVAKELKRLWGRQRPTGNGRAGSRVLTRRAKTMPKDSALEEMTGGHG